MGKKDMQAREEKKGEDREEGDEVKRWGRYGDILLNKNQ